MDRRLEEHLDRLDELLDAERREEQARFAAAKDALALPEQEAAGLVCEAQCVDEGRLGGRTLLTYGPVPGQGAELGGRLFSVGALVRVALRREPDLPDAPRGVVARRARDRIAVALEDEDDGPPEWATAGRVLLEVLPSSVTCDRLQGAVRRMKEVPRWHGVLSGAPLRVLPAPRPGREADPRPALPLNPEQQAAVDLAARAEDVALIHGPPGTGKTTVLVAVILQALSRGERVLCAAPSNLAVDNLVERLVQAGVRAVRLGHPARVLPAVLEHTLEAQALAHDSARIAAGLEEEARRLQRDARKAPGRRGPDRMAEARAARAQARALYREAADLRAVAEADVLGRAEVVLATLTGLDHPALSRRRFPLCVIDEATQAVEPAAYLALLRADRAVLAGDHLQLPPTVLSPRAQAGGLGLSLFERLLKDHERPGRPPLRVTLAEQHRMHQLIMGYPSQALYQGRLRAHPAVAGHVLGPGEAPLEFLDTAGCGLGEEAHGESRDNPGEATLAATEARRLLGLGLPAADLSVITPYEAQAQRLRQLLSAEVDDGLEVDTVDGFQGREKEAVVLSLVRSNDEGEVGFLSDVRRMNVALTRARRRLVVIGDGATVARHPFYEGLLRYAEAHDAWRSAWE